MANDIHLFESLRSMKEQVKAPRRLVNAAKRGERLTVQTSTRRKPDTTRTHVRRFSFAIVGYACVAVLLICCVAVASPLFQKSDLIAGDQPDVLSKPVPTEIDLNNLLPTYIIPENAGGYYRSDLLWANELNPDYKDRTVLDACYYPQTFETDWGPEHITVMFEQCFDPNLELPEVDASIAVTVSIHTLDDPDVDLSHVPYGEKQSTDAAYVAYDEILAARKNEFVQSFTGWEMVDSDGVFAVPLSQLVHFDRSFNELVAYISARCHEEAGEDSTEMINMRVILTVAWQGGARKVSQMTPDLIDGIAVGMDADAVEEVLGAPFRYSDDMFTAEYDLADGTVCSIHYRDAEGSTLAVDKICRTACAEKGCQDQKKPLFGLFG